MGEKNRCMYKYDRDEVGLMRWVSILLVDARYVGEEGLGRERQGKRKRGKEGKKESDKSRVD